jgi:hypothetical protein
VVEAVGTKIFKGDDYGVSRCCTLGQGEGCDKGIRSRGQDGKAPLSERTDLRVVGGGWVDLEGDAVRRGKVSVKKGHTREKTEALEELS